ncbi:MAG: hypothetical protein JWN13_4384 [Betaproteobacteria bacterium]|nr:hypothetical protein [Betaproteobacteria bacterium]
MAMKRVYLSLICVASALISRLRPLPRLRNGITQPSRSGSCSSEPLSAPLNIVQNRRAR